MINVLNKKIKVYLANSLIAEGSVTFQTDQLIELSVENNKSKLYINNPDDNVIMYIVYNLSDNKDEQNLHKEIEEKDNKIKKILSKKTDKIIESSKDLKELYDQKANLEKNIIKNKLLKPEINSQEFSYGTVSHLNDFNLSKKTPIWN